MLVSSTLESTWLEYVRRLLGDTDHIAACNRVLGPEAESRADASDLRWPGYLGSGYQAGGLLLVATVHREFASGRLPLADAEKQRLIDGTRAWRDSRLDDRAWLEIVREVYECGLERHWAVGRVLCALHRRIGLHVRNVAYVNAARCQVVENPPCLAHHDRIIKNVVALCAGAYPVTSMAEMLQPAAVIMSKGAYDAAEGTLDLEVPVLVVDQRQLCLRADCTLATQTLRLGTRVDEWARHLSDLLP